MSSHRLGRVARVRPRLVSLSLLVAPLLVGCGGGLKLTPIKSAQNPPSNVATYFRVETRAGEPVGGMTADQFEIYEDDGLVSQYESKQTILNPEVAASHYTLLLVDMSGSVADSEGTVDTLTDAATAFTDRVEKQQKVAVYAFDGSAELHPISPFSSGGGAKAGIARLKSYKPQDPSTNLHGAIINGLKELDTSLSHAEHPLRFGTLVVFTDGTDRAARVSNEDMKKAVKDSPYEIFAIGLGPELSEAQLKEIGKDGTAKAADKAAVVKAFDEIAQRIEARTKSYYLLSYCSPARAGKHEVKVRAIYKDPQGGEKSGDLRQEFDATGFGKGCDPNTPPHFDMSKGDALAPPEKTEKKDDDVKKPAAKPAAPASGSKPKTGASSGTLPPPPPPQDFNP